MVGKRVQFTDETSAAVNPLRQERRRSFQQLADEAFANRLQKYHRPADLKSQLRESMGLPPLKRKPRPVANPVLWSEERRKAERDGLTTISRERRMHRDPAIRLWP